MNTEKTLDNTADKDPISQTNTGMHMAFLRIGKHRGDEKGRECRGGNESWENKI